MNPTASEHAMFILYEAAHIETFRSPGLLARLNDPTEWSKRVQPGLVNFLRAPCRTLVSLGEGVGGALMAIRVSSEVDDKMEAGHSLASAAPSIARLHGVTAVHVGQHVPGSVETAETKLRPAASSATLDFVVLIEGIGVNELENVMNGVVGMTPTASLGSYEAGVYRLAYLLESNG